jgi:hypothetical protein
MLDLDHHGLRKHAAFDAKVLEQARARAAQLSKKFWQVLEASNQADLRWPSAQHPAQTPQEV